jgi:hypothetical protein
LCTSKQSGVPQRLTIVPVVLLGNHRCTPASPIVRQRLTYNVGAGDASIAPTVTTTSHSSQQGQRQRWYQQEEQQEQQRGAVYTAIMESLKHIVKGNEQLRIDQEWDQVREQELEC